ncbi:TetR family transcriptional regulator [Nocardia stercoris]|uniref:TetR family transcriptional regulator n=1 Tax=Nocardia stercoris TaxID=2483361 RepID=A0A3M2L5W4_9NOCA|nr:TetR family transcriptional regulator [Nocardia stercoris]RMI29938.1 TetR family transcriptional regulator [Nocardia stercoris]
MPDPAPVTQRAAAAARTRDALLEAGLTLAERIPLPRISANVVVAAAGVSKGTFFHHFPTRADYLVALHETFHDRLEREIATLARDCPPGPERLHKATELYLDRCLRDASVRTLLIDARTEPGVAQAAQHRTDATAEHLIPDFTALGSATPRASAQLWIRLVREAALLEADAGHRLEALRAALADFVRPTRR